MPRGEVNNIEVIRLPRVADADGKGLSRRGRGKRSAGGRDGRE